jgi:hypothetical protein
LQHFFTTEHLKTSKTDLGFYKGATKDNNRTSNSHYWRGNRHSHHHNGRSNSHHWRGRHNDRHSNNSYHRHSRPEVSRLKINRPKEVDDG